MKEIKIRGAKIHNLKNVTISIPKNKLIVATGVSGSGKSSLVFDIIFEEGRRQYLQSLGMFSEIDNENKFQSIEGLGPAVAVRQNIIRQSNPRSTVGSRTGILNMLGLLYSLEGQMHCSICKKPLNSNLTCNHCGYTEKRFKPSFFSYHSSDGMCMKCLGKGGYFELNLNKLISDHHITLEQVFKQVKVTPGYMRILKKRWSEYFSTPFWELPTDIKNEVIYGHYENGKRSYSLTKIFEGRYQRGENLNGIYEMTICDECQGFRIGEEARSVLLNEKHIGELGKMSILQVHEFLEDLLKQDKLTPFSQNLVTDLLKKTNGLICSRLGYLTLYREMSTLSGGEIQRLFLNEHLNSKLDSLIYVLDEPTAGLHESEKQEMLKAIIGLKEHGNTVIVVEHDQNTIKNAEHIIDIGPKAGVLGGEVIYQGNLAGLLQSNESVTGQYLSGRVPMPVRKTFQTITKESDIQKLTIRNANTNNLKNLCVSFPLEAMVGIAGKSGSGKSSLISNTLLPLLRSHFAYKGKDVEEEEEPDFVTLSTEKLEGMECISGFAEISQKPIGRNMNSNPATYIGIWDKIRALYAMQPKALEQNFTSAYFSFHSKGACPKCGGNGYEKIWLAGNVSIDKTCSECHGKRFKKEVLEVKYHDKNIVDILEMSVSEAIDFFKDNPSITTTLKILDQIGMGYVTLGQPTPTLSGGESQRIKLAKEIGKRRKGNILYVLDEPTTGLSLYDTAKLISLLDELVAKGNSVFVVEHDTEVLKICDWLIELGPEGGQKGGYLIAEGSPKELKANKNSITGRYL